MAGITKNFIVKNGLEVNGGLFIVNTDNNKVGVGTTVLTHDFNVKGGIGVTNVVITGIATVNQFVSTHSQLGVATASFYRVGTTTVFETSGGLVSLSGIQTIDSTAKTTLQNQLFTNSTIGGLLVTGIATFNSRVAIGGSLDVDGQGEFDDINVSGVSTFVGIATYQNTLFGTQLSLSGISTLSGVRVGSAVTITSGGINHTGVSTIRNINSTQAGLTNLNVTGVSTLSSAIVGSAVTITSDGLNVTGIVTSTKFDITGTTNTFNSGGLNVSGVVTSTSARIGSGVTITSGGINATGLAVTASTFFGSGANLTGIINLGVSTSGGFVGSGVTLLNFLGSGIVAVYTNSSTGIATVIVSGTGGGGGTPGGSNNQVQYNSSSTFAGSANFTFDGTTVGVGTIRLNGSGISAGIITGTSFSGSGSGITDLTNSNLSGSAGITNANLANSTISGISLGGTLGTLTLQTTGTGLSGSASYTGTSGQTFTVTSNAQSANAFNSIVSRDGAGGFVAGIVTASSFSGPITGNVTGNINSTGISTISSLIVGSGTTITEGGLNAVGVISATSYNTKGSGGYKISGTDIITSSREIQKVVLKSYAEKYYNFGNTGTAPILDLSNGNFVTATLTGNATWVFSLGTGVTSDAIAFTLHLTNDGTGGRTITWPISVKWPNNTVPTRTTDASKTDVYTFYTYDGGSNWYGNLSLYNYS